MTDSGVWETGKTETKMVLSSQVHSSKISKFLKGNTKKKLSIDCIQGRNFTFFTSNQIFNMIALYYFENNMYKALTMAIRMVKGCFLFKPLF